MDRSKRRSREKKSSKKGKEKDKPTFNPKLLCALEAAGLTIHAADVIVDDSQAAEAFVRAGSAAVREKLEADSRRTMGE